MHNACRLRHLKNTWIFLKCNSDNNLYLTCKVWKDYCEREQREGLMCDRGGRIGVGCALKPDLREWLENTVEKEVSLHIYWSLILGQSSEPTDSARSCQSAFVLNNAALGFACNARDMSKAHYYSRVSNILVILIPNRQQQQSLSIYKDAILDTYPKPGHDGHTLL